MLLFLLTCVLHYTAAVSHKLHETLTDEEIKKLFHVDHPSKVPEYETVWLRSVRKREVGRGTGRPENSLGGDDRPGHNLRLAAFGRELDLKLSRNHHFSRRIPLYSVTANSSGHLVYQLLPHQDEWGETYQDLENQAALTVHTDPADGSVLYEGTIGENLVVRPLPHSVRKSHDLGKNHVVFKRNQSLEPQYSDYALMEPGDVTHPIRKKRSLDRRKREAPHVIYPEILVIVDYDGYRLHGGDNVQIKRYFISFWNGVDLRYKLLKGPKVRISIAGIIISRGRDATPYLERNRVGRDGIDSAAALTDMGKYLFRERRLPVYDIAVSITKYDMCRRRKGGRCTKGTAGKTLMMTEDGTGSSGYEYGERLDMCRRQFPSEACNRGTAGFAYVGGACVVNKRLEKVNSVAIIEDTGGFSGIIVAAHEVGHLLGAVHDGSPPPTYLGGPGAEKCRWEDGYIMSDLRHTEKGFRWSPCSVQSFHHFLNGDTATCLYNSPHEDESLPRVLPGKLLSLDAQCRRDRGTSACFKDDRVCAQLFCFDSGSGYCVAYRPAAEGSPCGDGQYCSGGRCIVENENIIPDFSQHPGFLRRSDDFNNTTRKQEEETKSVIEASIELPDPKSPPLSPIIQSVPIPTVNSGVPPTESECVDEERRGPTCGEMIERYGSLYCPTEYIRKHCCAAHRYLCPKHLRRL